MISSTAREPKIIIKESALMYGNVEYVLVRD